MAILRRVFRDIAPERGPVQFKNLATMNFPTTMQSTKTLVSFANNFYFLANIYIA